MKSAPTSRLSSLVDISPDETQSDDGDSPPAETSPVQSSVLAEIEQALKRLQFGEITITVRDGRVIQIDRVSRKRQIISKRI